MNKNSTLASATGHDDRALNFGQLLRRMAEYVAEIAVQNHYDSNGPDYRACACCGNEIQIDAFQKPKFGQELTHKDDCLFVAAQRAIDMGVGEPDAPTGNSVESQAVVCGNQISAGAAVLDDSGKPVGRNVALMVYDAMHEDGASPLSTEPTSVMLAAMAGYAEDRGIRMTHNDAKGIYQEAVRAQTRRAHVTLPAMPDPKYPKMRVLTHGDVAELAGFTELQMQDYAFEAQNQGLHVVHIGYISENSLNEMPLLKGDVFGLSPAIMSQECDVAAPAVKVYAVPVTQPRQQSRVSG